MITSLLEDKRPIVSVYDSRGSFVVSTDDTIAAMPCERIEAYVEKGERLALAIYRFGGIAERLFVADGWRVFHLEIPSKE